MKNDTNSPRLKDVLPRDLQPQRGRAAEEQRRAFLARNRGLDPELLYQRNKKP